MSRPASSLADARVAVVGLGLMGGSMCLALAGKCAQRLGSDPDPAAVREASARGVVDRGDTDPARIVPGADLVVFAAPVRAIVEGIDRLPALHEGSPVVMDLGSTKRRVADALERLPSRFEAIGGHPMCGRETRGIEHADAGLFLGATFALAANARTGPRARKWAGELVEAVGAKPLWIEPDRHDRWTAATSHAPYVVSAALARAVPDEAVPLAGPGLRSATRLAGTDAAMMLDILATNREEVLGAIERVRDELDGWAEDLADGRWDRLRDRMERSAASRRRWTGETGPWS